MKMGALNPFMIILNAELNKRCYLRGNHDFYSVDMYQAFIDNLVWSHNRYNAETLSIAMHFTKVRISCYIINATILGMLYYFFHATNGIG